jgi:hypothetical protein
VLVEGGRLDEADLGDALVIAERLNSPFGITGVTIAAG